METCVNTLISLGHFKTHEFIFSQFQNQKLARNSVALLHAIITVVQNLFYMKIPHPKLYELCKIWSSGYFLWDTLFILQQEKLNILRLAYIYHHLTAIYIINKPPQFYHGDTMLFWGELSNIPSYFVYYYLHTNPESSELKSWLKLQKWFYGCIRIPILGKMLISLWKTAPNKFPIAVISPVYLMGVIWTYTLFNK